MRLALSRSIRPLWCRFRLKAEMAESHLFGQI